MREANLKTRRIRRAVQRGMTLVEIMIVVVIMSLIASAVGLAVFNQAKKAKMKTAEQDVHAIEHAVGLWQQDHSGCPTMDQLISDGELSRQQRSRDPWNNDFSISCDNGEVTVRSKGPDGREGTDDDIPQQRQSAGR